MELDGLARCLAHLRAGNGSPNDLTWKKIERLIHLCPNCQFKSINKMAGIRQLRAALERQKERKPPFDRLYPPSDQLLDIKPDSIYHFDELEQQSVLALCKYLCVSRGQYLHKILPLLLRYLATLHLAKWPPHYFKNLFLMKYQHNQNTDEVEHKTNETNEVKEEQEAETVHAQNTDIKTETENNLIAILEEPEKMDKARDSMLIEDDVNIDDDHIAALTADISNPDGSDEEHKGDEAVASDADDIEIKYEEDTGEEEEIQTQPKASQNKLNDADNDLLKYMDNPLHSPLCQFVMEFVYNIGDISHAVEECAPIIRQAVMIILKEYIKILKEDDDGLQNNLGDEYNEHKSSERNHHSFYVVLPIIWGILNAIKEDVYVSINIDRKCALSISKCVDTLSKYNKHNAFSGYWKSEWDILSTGVRASLLAYFLPPSGPCKAPKKVFETKTIKDYFNASMAIIGVKKSPASIVLREQHMRLATICAIYETRLRNKLEKTIKDILHFHINKYIKSSFNVYHRSGSAKNKQKVNKQKQKQNKKGSSSSMAPRTLKYRMRDQTILINACCLVLEQLAERAPDQLQEISYYLQKLLIDRNAIYIQDEEINERLMDALARVCQCELKYMEQHPMYNKQHQMYTNANADDDLDEEKQLLFEDEEDEHAHTGKKKLTTTHAHHKKASSGVIGYNDHNNNKHWYDDSSTRTVFNELENNFNDSVNEDSKLINRALRIYGAMMVKVNHKLITQQFLHSSLKGRLTQKLTVILPYLIDTAINQQATEVLFVKEIVQLLVQSYLSKSSSYQLDTKRKIAEAFTELSSNITQYNLRQFILCELLKMFTTVSKTILSNHIKKQATLPLFSNELGLILPAIAVLCTPLYPLEAMQHEQDMDEVVDVVEDDVDDDDDEQHQATQSHTKQHKKRFKINIKKRDKKHRRQKENDTDVHRDIETEDVNDNNNNNNNNNENDTDHTIDNPSYFGTNEYIAESWGVTLMDNHSQTVTMFREFWNQIIFFDFVASTNNEYKMYLQTIASVSPVLVSGSSTLVSGGLIHEVLKNKTNSLNINKQIIAMRGKLGAIIKLDVHNLAADALLFLNVVYHVETFRVYSGTAYALAHYLNDAGIIRMDLQNYIEAIVDYVFDRYLEHIYQSKASSDKLISLESHVEYLLAMCCSRSSRIRGKCYNWLQHKLIAAYSYLQWRPKCLQNVLDIVSKLERLVDDVSTELYSANDAHSVITFNDKFSLDLPEDRKSRSEIRGIILDIAGAWLHSAWNLAPSEMISVVAHKLSLYKSPLLSSLMYTQCKFNAHRDDGGNSQPNMGLMYVVSKCERYLGVMEGLYRTHLLHHIRQSFGQSKANLFIQTFKRYIAMQSKVNGMIQTLHEGMIEEMYQVAALIVWTYNKNINISPNNRYSHHFKLPLEQLLHLLCMVPAIIFHSNLVLCGTFVWRWIMTTSPELQESLIRQMRPAWSFVIEQRKGIFANKSVNNAKEIEAHDIWISWLLNSMENIIESSPESVENISVIMIDGLAAIPYDNDNNNNNTNHSKQKHITNTAQKTESKGSEQKQKTQSKGSETRKLKDNKHKQRRIETNDKKKKEEERSRDDTYIATFGARLRFYTAVARILNALRLASVPLLSKTIATMLRGRLYQGVLQLFECKIVWRYPSSWKDVTSNAKTIVELFQFFLTEHRQIIRNNHNNNNIPSPPSISIANHRSKSKLLHGDRDRLNGVNELMSNNRPRPSLTTTMPYLNTRMVTRTDLSGAHHGSIGSLHHHSHTHAHSRMKRIRHKKAKSMYYNQQWGSSVLRPRPFTNKSHTHRSPSIRRNSFGHGHSGHIHSHHSHVSHASNVSFDLDDALLLHDSGVGVAIGEGHTGHSLILETETMNDVSMESIDNLNDINKANASSNKYLFKLDSDDVYYWEGNNAFIQDIMTNWLHLKRGWAQMLCCVLLADELERLCAWYNTVDVDTVDADDNNSSRIADEDDELDGEGGNNYKKKNAFLSQLVLIEYICKITDSDWNVLIDTSWSFDALLSVRFYERFKYRDYLLQFSERLRDHIHREPKSIVSIPSAVHLLITASTVKKDGIELEELCQFSCAPLYKCLSLLTEKTLTHSIVNQYLFRSLRNESQRNMENVIFLIPQLLQALRFDPSGILRSFLIDCAANDLTMAHQLIWLCDTESYQGEDMHSIASVAATTTATTNDNDLDDNDMHGIDEEDFCKAMERLSCDIRETFNDDCTRAFSENEFEFFDLINCASVDIEASKYSKKQKKNLIRASLIEIRDCLHKYAANKLYMPTNPTWQIVDVLPDSVIALQSAAKVPFLVDFEVRKYQDDIGHMLQFKNEIFEEPKIEIQKCIFKTHDDCGQDALALQIIEYFKHIFSESGLPLLLFPYRVIATRSGKDKVVGGMIECVKNARSRSDLGAENGYRLRRYFIETYGDIECASFRGAQRNFILSLAGYAVVCYLLQIKDRHNANIMINTDGHLIHIDFGFLFDTSPGGNMGFETAGFKINDEMVELIGDDGSHTTPLFLWFVDLCIRGYLVCREHMDQIMSIIQLSSNSNLPCFLPQTMTNLRNRFVPEKSPTQAAQHMKERVIHACSTWTTNAYDEFQKRSQGIWKAPAKDED